MSTSPRPANLSPAWKQEVNRRVAAHLNRKAPLEGEREAAHGPQLTPDSRAAQAAARVAARYAKAPSYSEMLAAEARAAILAAEVASQAALDAQVAAQAAAQVAAQSVLASLEAASLEAAEPRWQEPQHIQQLDLMQPFELEPAEFEIEASSAAQTYEAETYESRTCEYETHSGEMQEDRAFAIRWEPDMPVRGHGQPTMRATHGAGLPDLNVQDWNAQDWADAFPGRPIDEMDVNGMGMIEPAQPIYANLIEFPRPLIAARKVRPRLAEGPLADAGTGAQLSIFEVDPGAISIEPEPASTTMEAASPSWSEPEWSSIKLGAQPAEEFLREMPQAALAPDTAKASAIDLAPLTRRTLAITVDFGLVAGAFASIAYLIASRTSAFLGLRAAEIGSLLAIMVIGAVYESFFLSFATATPGMWYAGVRLCTFEDEMPTRRQRSARLVALLVSVLPMGLGLAWAIFDEDHLTWHDRLSRTYLRQG